MNHTAITHQTPAALLAHFDIGMAPEGAGAPADRIVVGIRENERRAELLGYDPRAYKLATFTIGAALAGYAGCLFANWGAFVSPTIFGLAQSAQIIIWVIVGGRGTYVCEHCQPRPRRRSAPAAPS